MDRAQALGPPGTRVSDIEGLRSGMKTKRAEHQATKPVAGVAGLCMQTEPRSPRKDRGAGRCQEAGNHQREDVPPSRLTQALPWASLSIPGLSRASPGLSGRGVPTTQGFSGSVPVHIAFCWVRITGARCSSLTWGCSELPGLKPLAPVTADERTPLLVHYQPSSPPTPDRGLPREASGRA